MGTSEMSSDERIQTVIPLRIPDRVPIIVRSRSFSVKHSGLKMSDCWGNADLYIDCQLRCWKEFGYDTVEDYPGSDICIIEAMGGKINVQENNIPGYEPIIENPNDLEKLSVPDLRQGSIMGQVRHIIEVLRKETGIPVLASVQAPFNLACSLRGIQQLYIDMIERPEFVQELLEFALKIVMAFMSELDDFKAGTIAYVVNPPANRTCISRTHYQKFVTNYTRRFFEFLHEEGFKIIFHVCGDWTDRMDLAVQEKPDILFFGDGDMADIKATVGRQVCLMGNVKTVETLFRGTPEQVKNETIECIRKAGAGGGYILSADCTLAPNTPAANLRALIETGKSYGAYPLKF